MALSISVPLNFYAAIQHLVSRMVKTPRQANSWKKHKLSKNVMLFIMQLHWHKECKKGLGPKLVCEYALMQKSVQVNVLCSALSNCPY